MTCSDIFFNSSCIMSGGMGFLFQHVQRAVLPLSSYVAILAQSVCKLAQEAYAKEQEFEFAAMVRIQLI